MQENKLQPIHDDMDANPVRQAYNSHARVSSDNGMPETAAEPPTMHRRPIAAREHGWARALSSALARCAITPNQISVFSVLFAGAGAAMLVWMPTPMGWLGCAACVQLRLLCNLLDGMVAVEGASKPQPARSTTSFPIG